MRILVFSDLHLACSDDVDNFQKTKDFLEFIEWKNNNNIDKTIVNGDIFELWQGGWFLTQKRRYEIIKKRYKDVISNLKHFTIISGNHDNDVKYYNDEIKPIEKYIIKDNGLNILFLHGHQFDEQYKTNFSSYIGRVGTEFWGIIEKIIGTDEASKILSSFENLQMKQKMLPSKFKDMNMEYVEKSIEYAKKENFNIIVLGHTHIPFLYYDKTSKIYYVNSGTWIDDDNQNFVIIDTNEKTIEVNNFEDKNYIFKIQSIKIS